MDWNGHIIHHRIRGRALTVWTWCAVRPSMEYFNAKQLWLGAALSLGGRLTTSQHSQRNGILVRPNFRHRENHLRMTCDRNRLCCALVPRSWSSVSHPFCSKAWCTDLDLVLCAWSFAKIIIIRLKCYFLSGLVLSLFLVQRNEFPKLCRT